MIIYMWGESNMTNKSFGEHLATLRERKGWMQCELAFRTGVKTTTISNWEKGISRPNFNQIYKLRQVLGVTLDHLLETDKMIMTHTLNLWEYTFPHHYRNSMEELCKVFSQCKPNSTIDRASDMQEEAKKTQAPDHDKPHPDHRK